jgi:S1-C subfamily serine protease
VLLIGGLIFWLMSSAAQKERADEENRLQAQQLAEERKLEAQRLADQQRAEQEKEAQREKKPDEIVAQCGPAVALIRYKNGGGTGFLIRPGIVATNAHVIEQVPIDELKVYLPSSDSAKTAFPARLLYFDAKRDLAFLLVPTNVPPLRLADQFEFRSGQGITVIGCPGIGEKQLENAVSIGVLSTRTELRKQSYYQLNISVNPGNSGGPVFDARGQVIGVVTLKSTREGIAFCIPWQDLKDAVALMDRPDRKQVEAQAVSSHSLFLLTVHTMRAFSTYSRRVRFCEFRMQEAQATGRSVDDALARARADIGQDRSVDEPLLLTERYRLMTEALKADTHLPESTRKKFFEVLATCLSLRDHYENPSGPYAAYRSKADAMRGRYQQQLLELVALLGFERETPEP